MTNKRTHIISDKITEKSTYIVITDEAIDNSKINLEGQQLKFESAYIIINDEATNEPKSKINLEEYLLD
ncbi:8032_t:CDS:2 [Scutellospora calospora]|uniref:8032_t:CDS:1 n=1 Tax=Scutellospora calospora TaxID=85575 RepID=A0ACA9KHY7_9GLOM|nr:8032_t:CDS:2 [Scutellospora calospora]